MMKHNMTATRVRTTDLYIRRCTGPPYGNAGQGDNMNKREGTDQLFQASSRPNKVGRFPCRYAFPRPIFSLGGTLDTLSIELRMCFRKRGNNSLSFLLS